MPLPESQLEIWSHQGATITAKNTCDSIKNALCCNTSTIHNKDFDIYIQGSYKNSTNIRGDSDVDIIVQLNSTFKYDFSCLPSDQKTLFNQAYLNATYSWSDFKNNVIETLQNYYGKESIIIGNKSLKVSEDSGRLPADVVVCLQYRKYSHFRSISDQKYFEGIIFYAIRENRWVINFPKLHYINGVNKNNQYRTNGWYKPSVRIFKNARTCLVNKNIIDQSLVPSYFLECLLYNVPDEKFGNKYERTFLSVINWITESFSNNQYQNFLCQNEQLQLFGSTPEQWSKNNAIKFLIKLIDLWKD